MIAHSRAAARLLLRLWRSASIRSITSDLSGRSAGGSILANGVSVTLRGYIIYFKLHESAGRKHKALRKLRTDKRGCLAQYGDLNETKLPGPEITPETDNQHDITEAALTDLRTSLTRFIMVDPRVVKGRLAEVVKPH